VIDIATMTSINDSISVEDGILLMDMCRVIGCGSLLLDCT